MNFRNVSTETELHPALFRSCGCRPTINAWRQVCCFHRQFSKRMPCSSAAICLRWTAGTIAPDKWVPVRLTPDVCRYRLESEQFWLHKICTDVIFGLSEVCCGIFQRTMNNQEPCRQGLSRVSDCLTGLLLVKRSTFFKWEKQTEMWAFDRTTLRLSSLLH